MDQPKEKENDLQHHAEKLKKLFTEKNLFMLLIAFAIIYRVYYFILTYHQPQWWDSGDYLNIARMWAFGSPEWDINPLRPLLFPFLIAILYKFGAGEALLQVFVTLSSIIAVYLAYLLGKHMYNKKIGLIAAYMLAVFWSFTFYSFRILVDVPVAMFWLLALHLFWVGYEENKKKALWLFGPALALGFMMKFTGALLGFIVLMYLIITARLKFLKNKDLWISAALGFLTMLPFLIYEKIRFGSFLAFYTAAIGGRALSPRSMWQTLIDYITQTLPLVRWIFFALFVVGLIFIVLDLVLGFDLLFKNKEKTLKTDLLVLITFLVPFLYIVSIGYGQYIEERYLFLVYPTMFLVAAKGVMKINSYLKKIPLPMAGHVLPVIVTVCILAVGGYQNMVHADQIINDKKESYRQVQLAGEWIKQNSEKEDKLFALHAHAELQYAAERRVLGYPGIDPEDLMKNLRKHKPKYLVANVFAYLPDDMVWKLIYPFQHPEHFKPVQAYEPAIDKEGKIPILTIFEVLPAAYSAPVTNQSSQDR